jgi:putative heme iron utilization protein
MSWAGGVEQVGGADPWASAAASSLTTDHADAMVLYCRAFSQATEITSASMTGIDRYGFEMSARTTAGPRPVRLAFASPISTAADARAVLISMLKDARSKLGMPS